MYICLILRLGQEVLDPCECNITSDTLKKLREQARDNYRNLSEEDKNKRRVYGRNRYHNTSEEKKQKLKEYQKRYGEAEKSQYNNQYNSFGSACCN